MSGHSRPSRRRPRSGVLALPAGAWLPAFYESFLFLVFFWVSLATSWGFLSGYAGYFSLGHGAFFGVGMYTTATLTAKFGVPFLATLPAAAAVSALLAVGIGAVVFRLRRLRGELFGLLTLAVTFVHRHHHPQHADRRRRRRVHERRAAAAPHGLADGHDLSPGLRLCAADAGDRLVASPIRGSASGLFAIHDDEDVAEAKGVPTFRYKLAAFALSAGIAGAVGGIHAMYVGFVTVGETFRLTVPLYVVLMSVLGGSRHWLGPAVGATAHHGLALCLHQRRRGDARPRRRGLILILAILWLPDGVVPAVRRWLAAARTRRGAGGVAEVGAGRAGDRAADQRAPHR